MTDDALSAARYKEQLQELANMNEHLRGDGDDSQDQAEMTPDQLIEGIGDPVQKYAHFLGIQPGPEDVALRWIAEEALAAQLPEGWSEHMDDDGNLYYYHLETEQSSWTHPLESHYKQLVILERQRLADSTSANKLKVESAAGTAPASRLLDPS
eukprot:SAG31_NODE_15065_length_772_cov_1.426449_1_plen_153_part_10